MAKVKQIRAKKQKLGKYSKVMCCDENMIDETLEVLPDGSEIVAENPETVDLNVMDVVELPNETEVVVVEQPEPEDETVKVQDRETGVIADLPVEAFSKSTRISKAKLKAYSELATNASLGGAIGSAVSFMIGGLPLLVLYRCYRNAKKALKLSKEQEDKYEDLLKKLQAAKTEDEAKSAKASLDRMINSNEGKDAAKEELNKSKEDEKSKLATNSEMEEVVAEVEEVAESVAEKVEEAVEEVKEEVAADPEATPECVECAAAEVAAEASEAAAEVPQPEGTDDLPVFIKKVENGFNVTVNGEEKIAADLTAVQAIIAEAFKDVKMDTFSRRRAMIRAHFTKK